LANINAPETINANHPALCDDKSISFYLNTSDGLDVSNGFSLHIDHVFKDVGEYPHFPFVMGLWFTVSGDAIFNPEADRCDSRNRTCSFMADTELRMNLTCSISSTKSKKKPEV
jgi:hypothetical protein